MSLLIAAAIDWLETLLPVLFVGWWILSQIVTIFRRPKKQSPRVDVVGDKKLKTIPSQKRDMRPLDAPASTIQKSQPRKSMSPKTVASTNADPSRRKIDQEIQEFLTKSRSEGRAGTQQELTVEKKQINELRKRISSKSGRVPDTSSEVSVEAFLETNGAEESVAEHVSEAFAHDLKHEVPGKELVAAPDQTQTESLSFATLLRDPRTLRQLVVMREILDRPSDRW